MGSGDPMLGRKVRLAALATTAVGVLALAGCSAGDPVNAPPPASDRQDASMTPELMGAPPPPSAEQAQDGLLGGPSQAQAQARADAGVSSSQLPPPPSRNSHLKTWRRPDGTLVTAMRPIANPKGVSRYEQKPHRVHATIPAAHAAPKPVVVAKPVTPKTVAPAPAPVQAVKPAVPAAPLAKPPVVAAKPPVVPAAPAKPATKLEQLQAAVAPAATNGAVLAAGESLGKNQPGQVTLSLPATLGDLIKQEAAKLGLTKAAKKTSAYAELSGDGYEVTPNGRQTAVVKPGEPTTFAWQVKPGPEAKGQLKSHFGLELNGAKTPQGFSLGEISKRVAALPEQAKKGVGKLDLGGLNGNITLPGLGPVPIKTALGVALVLLALIILVGVSRSASAARRRAERQRKYRTLTDYGRNEMEFEQEQHAPASTHVSHVNPFLAAAGGAVAGAAVASAFSRHDDHGHGHDDHGQGHDSHGHDAHAHAHDDHGHAAPDGHSHDLHAEAHPEPHAPAEHVSYVNPMIAAASAHPVSHDDHGHGTHAAAHDDHHGEHAAPHDEPAHAAPGHDAHAAGHQDAHHKEPEPAH
jgi:Na+-transporting methylmalonyl-CoA/oxaloacetate decarboxylase gamma subunit